MCDTPTGVLLLLLISRLCKGSALSVSGVDDKGNATKNVLPCTPFRPPSCRGGLPLRYLSNLLGSGSREHRARYSVGRSR
ncbi:hypothetical protein F4778DRAFT_719315 [Xylariomycetidae sp. FL2044]|nr:hypothetical protein F4778DRAFT_719315 [Xylariomycetidae sp. FL2044]